jgi:hypothetical protein
MRGAIPSLLHKCVFVAWCLINTGPTLIFAFIKHFNEKTQWNASLREIIALNCIFKWSVGRMWNGYNRLRIIFSSGHFFELKYSLPHL